MKGITKDCLSLYSMKAQCRKMLHYISGHTFQFPSVVRESPVFMIYYPHLNCLVIPPT